MDETDFKFVEIKKMIQDYLSSKEWRVSGHEDIFKYRIAMLDLSKKSKMFDFSETNSIEECDLIICEFIYHKQINPIIFAAETQYLEGVKKEFSA